MAKFDLNIGEIERLQKAMADYVGNTEEVINNVIHNEGGPLIEEQIYLLMPVSKGKGWKGKKPHAKHSKSLKSVNSNLAVTVKTTNKYHYLYFPDDGTNTRRHIGNKQFFRKGGEAVTDEIIDRCIAKLVNNFEKEI